MTDDNFKRLSELEDRYDRVSHFEDIETVDPWIQELQTQVGLAFVEVNDLAQKGDLGSDKYFEEFDKAIDLLEKIAKLLSKD